MAHDKFNQIPSQCAGVCPLDQEAVDKNGAVLSRNCPGPRAAKEGEAGPIGTTVVKNGEAIIVNDYPNENVVGQMACRNMGLILWTEAKRKQFRIDSLVQVVD